MAGDQGRPGDAGGLTLIIFDEGGARNRPVRGTRLHQNTGGNLGKFHIAWGEACDEEAARRGGALHRRVACRLWRRRWERQERIGRARAPASAPAPAPAPARLAPAVSVAVSSAPVSQNIDYGDEFNTALDGTWNGSNLGGATVYLQVTDSGNTFTMPSVQAAPANNTFHYTLNASTDVQAGDRNGTLTVRACKDQACSAGLRQRHRERQLPAAGRGRGRMGNHPARRDPQRLCADHAGPEAVRQSMGMEISRRTPPRSRRRSPERLRGRGRRTSSEPTPGADGGRYGVTLYALDEGTGNVKWNSSLTGQQCG